METYKEKSHNMNTTLYVFILFCSSGLQLYSIFARTRKKSELYEIETEIKHDTLLRSL